MRGIDLGQLWRARRWRKLLNLIDQLPRDSHYVEAQLDDEELAALMLTLPAPAASRRMSEWTPEVEALAVVIDRLTEVIAVQIAAAGGTAPTFQAYLRPATAADRVRARERMANHRALVARLIPTSREEDS